MVTEMIFEDFYHIKMGLPAILVKWPKYPKQTIILPTHEFESST